MGAFKEYMRSGVSMPEAELNELIRRYEWFTAARIVRAAERGVQDRRMRLAISVRAQGSLQLLPVNGAALTELSPEELIDRFLSEEDLRIVAGEGEAAEEIRTEAEIAEEDDLASEELAEIYLAQGLREEAVATYRKLSLRNSEKSVYFAQIIERIETNN